MITNKSSSMFSICGILVVYLWCLSKAALRIKLVNYSFFVVFFYSSPHHPNPGPCIPDVIMAAFMGVAACLIFAPLLPPLLRHLARPSFLALLLATSLLSASLLSVCFFPYSPMAPKRVAIFRAIWTQPHTEPSGVCICCEGVAWCKNIG